MIDYLQWCRLKEMAERDRLTAAQIARALGLAARTVRKWLKEPYRPRKHVQRASTLDPFKGQIMGMLKEHPYSAVQVLTMLQDQGFNGGISHPYGLRPVLNPRYADFAGHYGFTVKACGVRKANEKGIVENAVGYVKHNFLSGRPIGQFASLNPAVALWLEQTANVRIHGRTRRRPVDLFMAEKPLLTPLAPHPYDCALIHSVAVDRQFRVRVDGNRYSAPAAYAGRRLLLKLYHERLCLYAGETFVAEHLRSYERGQDIENPEHARPVLERKRRADEQHLVKRFLALSPEAETYYRNLAERKLCWRLHLRKIVALADVYGAEKVARALADALVYQAFSSEYIANILEQRERRLPDPGPLHLARKQDLLDLRMPDPDLSVYEADRTQPPEGRIPDEPEA